MASAAPRNTKVMAGPSTMGKDLPAKKASTASAVRGPWPANVSMARAAVIRHPLDSAHGQLLSMVPSAQQLGVGDATLSHRARHAGARVHGHAGRRRDALHEARDARGVVGPNSTPRIGQDNQVVHQPKTTVEDLRDAGAVGWKVMEQVDAFGQHHGAGGGGEPALVPGEAR